MRAIPHARTDCRSSQTPETIPTDRHTWSVWEKKGYITLAARPTAASYRTASVGRGPGGQRFGTSVVRAVQSGAPPRFEDMGLSGSQWHAVGASSRTTFEIHDGGRHLSPPPFTEQSPRLRGCTFRPCLATRHMSSVRR